MYLPLVTDVVILGHTFPFKKYSGVGSLAVSVHQMLLGVVIIITCLTKHLSKMLLHSRVSAQGAIGSRIDPLWWAH